MISEQRAATPSKPPARPNSDASIQFRAMLEELEALLLDERKALEKMDTKRVKALTDRKHEIDVELRAVVQRGVKSDDAIRGRIERVKKHALENQLLLAHARACVRGAISLITGRSVTPFPGGQSAISPIRVDIRG